jgi:hypothetical protein
VDGAVPGLDLTRLAYVKELAHALGLQDGG